MSSQTQAGCAGALPKRRDSSLSLVKLARWLHLPALMLLTTAGSLFLSVEITNLLLTMLHASGPMLRASHAISVSVPLMIAPAGTWLVGGLVVRAQAGRRRSEKLATIDPLTGVLNRRRFFQLAGPILWRSMRTGGRVALLLLDVDHFKRVNDTYGHATGDTVLRTLAECCIPHLRGHDLIARLGGEEFVVLLDEVTDAEARKRAELLRLAIAAQSIVAGEAARVRPTVSIGVAMSAGATTTLDSLLEVADRAMYAAKHAGRNRTCLGPDGTPVQPSTETESPQPDVNAPAGPRLAPSQVRRPQPSSPPGMFRLEIPGDDHAPYGFDSPTLARLSEAISRLGRHRTVLWVTGLSIAASVACGMLTLYSWYPTPRECLVFAAMCLAIPSIVGPLPGWFLATLSLEAEAAQRSAEHLASTDALTGLCNRRQFFRLAEHQFGAARRDGRPLAVLLFDIDHFKSINDNHGHATGDKVLTHIARVALGCLREADTLARYGGEEFVALLPNTSIEAASTLAERIRAAIAATPVKVPGAGSLHATSSVGVSEIVLDDTSLDALIDRADKAMYHAKRSGRDRVCTAG
jgi:diguanylate cyclase (GGDEF)-like protein